MTCPEISYSVIIIGAGPAGLSAAITLKKAGIKDIVVLERESEAGGIPRHCGHPPFGFKFYKQILTGPKYTQKNLNHTQTLGIEIRLNTTVTSLRKDGVINIASIYGEQKIKAKRVIIATGIRETPRSARFVSGDRPLGIYNTGALQTMIYLENALLFKRPVIIGTEIVSFSALHTCKKAKINPVAMIEKQPRPSVRWPFYYGAKIAFGTKVLLNTQLSKIIGKERVEAVEIIGKNNDKSILECDGVLFTGKFIPESSLIRMSHLEFDHNNSPIYNNNGRCSDPAYYVAGNVRQLSRNQGRNPWFYGKNNPPNAVNIAGVCWQQGQDVANAIIRDLENT